MTRVQLCLLFMCSYSAVLGRPQHDIQITDARQAALVAESPEHHIVVPYMITDKGDYLSHHLHHPRTRRSADSNDQQPTIHYHIPLKNEKYHLTLTRSNDLALPDVMVEYASGRTPSFPPKDCYFHGAVKNTSHSLAAISTCNGLAGMFRISKDQEYFIEPLFGVDKDEKTGRHHHLVYRRSLSDDMSHEHSHNEGNSTQPRCGVTLHDVIDRDFEVKPTRPPEKGFYLKKHRGRRSVSLMKNVEALLVADYSMAKFYKNNDLESYLFTVMNMVKLFFKHRSIGSAINIVLVRVVVLDKKNITGLNISNHAINTLNSFCSWVPSINPASDQDSKHADTAILITRRDICRDSHSPCNTIGMANVDGMCLSGSSCSYNQDTGFAVAYTIAHELGHNLGSLHDENYSGCAKKTNRIMASTLVANLHQNLWSKCTRKAIKSFFYKGWGWCLHDAPVKHPESIVQARLPGEIFSAEMQCQASYDINSTHCNATEEGVLCKVLWCRNVNGPCTAKYIGFKALDGTPCGKNKWCIRDKCKTRMELELPVDGDWGSWSKWSACSSTCGRGVRRKTRKCNSPRPEHGGNYCIGEWKKYVICNMKPCNPETLSKPEDHCKKFRSLIINGKRRPWTVKENLRNPCELRCVPILKKGVSQIRKFVQVKDGTSCNTGTLNICIQGKCEHVGCDNKLYSGAREDRCGVCRGDGSSCQTVQKMFTKVKGDGYEDAVVIPAGARNILIHEVTASPNFLALKSSKDEFYLNANNYIQIGGKYTVAGAEGLYSRRHNREKFEAKGPINEDLHVLLIFTANNPGVSIKYDVDVKGRKAQKWYKWSYGPWTICSVTCGRGKKIRKVQCVDETKHAVDEQYCTSGRPLSENVCFKPDCPASFWVGSWSECSKTCGHGEKFRPVLCTQVIRDQRNLLGDHQCSGEKPETNAPCFNSACWNTTKWSKCSSLCGPGLQFREVHCPGNESQCDVYRKPETNRTCMGDLCFGWVVEEWGNCSQPCGNGKELRVVTCQGPDETACDIRKKPISSRSCPGFACPAWSVGNWSQCSATCGRGIKLRDVSCVKYHPTSECNNSVKPISRKPCVNRTCSGWITRDWGPCSVTCGQGLRERKVVCIFKRCKLATRPVHREVCHLKDCARWLTEDWGECSAGCGAVGVRTRNVTCSVDDACLNDTKPLTSEECTTECLVWDVGNWSECSTSCGQGIQTRFIVCNALEMALCDKNKPIAQRLCYKKPCSEWTVTEYSECSKSCGGGVQNRSVSCSGVHCNASTKPEATRPCHVADCASWVTEKWGECRSTCGEGVKTRRVYCSSKNESDCDLVHKPNMRAGCFVSNCSQWYVTRWGSCSHMCGMGLRQRNVTCNNPDFNCTEPAPRTTEVCIQPRCTKWSTGHWRECSKSCGKGLQTRNVSCFGEVCPPSRKPTSTRVCTAAPCPRWVVGYWSKCSVTCGKGTQTRHVTCNSSHVNHTCAEVNKPTMVRNCIYPRCPYWNISPWGNCSSICGTGHQTRHVWCVSNATHACENSTKPRGIRECLLVNCSKWQVSDWSKCSVSCGGKGTRKRSVRCAIDKVCDMSTRPNDTDMCGENECPKWLYRDWGVCSKTCGVGRQTRVAVCSQNTTHACDHLTRSNITRMCHMPPCHGWLTSQWSSCSKSCGGGGRRMRYVLCLHRNCSLELKPKNTSTCGLAPCPRWSVGRWRTCSRSCGSGVQSRPVYCKNNLIGKCIPKEKPKKLQGCNNSPCPEWVVGAWGECTKTCGGGNQTRNVTCKNNHVGECLTKDKPTSSKGCSNVPCPEWVVGAWSKCTKTCGGGNQTRIVTCKNNHVGECLDNKPVVFRRCGDLPCPEWVVGAWSKCTKTCGGGNQTRNITCKNNHVGECLTKDKPTRSKGCSNVPCPEWVVGAWSKCTKTCGGGNQTRNVTCKNIHVGECLTKDKPTSSKGCSNVPCPKWVVGAWSECTKTCGGGNQTRNVTCKNIHVGECLTKDKPTSSGGCSNVPCPEWVVGAWSKCTKTCGGGNQTRNVTCKNNHVGECLTKDKPTSSKGCSNVPCPEWVVGAWSECTKTCGGGNQTRNITCKNNHVGECTDIKPDVTISCNELPCPEWVVGAWSECTKTCGGGNQTRNVTCKNNHVGECLTKDKPTSSKGCSKVPCPEWVAGAWSKCTKTCGVGNQSRNITCKNNHVGECLTKDKPNGSKGCSNVPCPEWVVGAWSECTKTCGGGNQTRNVTCKNNHVGECLTKDKPTSSGGCSNVPCPEWVVGAWSECTKTCGGGNQTRNVTCKNIHVGECLTKDKPTSSKGCSNVPCPEWVVGAWSECTKTCGGGNQTRNITCKNNHVGECTDIKPDVTISCNELPCPEWVVGAWSECAKTCGGGNQTRNVTCKNNHVGECLTKDKPTSSKGCSNVPCPEWVVGAWSECTKTCGGGNQTRNVTCKNNHVGECLTKDKPTSSKGCSNVPCPEWVAGAWSECTKTCGGGNQTRSVTCKNNHVGECSDDKPDVFRKCGDLPCPEWVVGAWSECTKSCGGGNQTRNVTCKNNHVGECTDIKPNVFKSCGDLPCPLWFVGEWSECSHWCGGGKQKRNVTCINSHVGDCESIMPVASKVCGELPCPKWVTGNWSECTKTCGGGSQTRNVTCSNRHTGECLDGSKPAVTQECGDLPCPKWVVGAWSKCTKTCGGGNQSRNITCKNNHVGECLTKDKPTSSKGCSNVPCPKWVVGAWSKCTKTCGGGNQTRNVTCKNNHVGECLTKDKPTSSMGCSNVPCPKWVVGAWSECTKTCGGGNQTRNVTCKNIHVGECLTKDKPASSKGCSNVPCPEWVVGAWSKCTKTCGGGNQTRNVTCKNNHVGECTDDKPDVFRKCGDLPCPEWVVGAWSECTKTCGGGNQTRNITCKNNHVGECTDMKPDITISCNELPCPKWVVGAWSECTKTCDGGNQTRNVTCKNNHVGECTVMKPEVTKECNFGPCPLWFVGEWSECSHWCGGGKQKRNVTCINSHAGDCESIMPVASKVCGELPCPKWVTGNWSECTKTCGGGSQTRNVTCSNRHTGECLDGSKPAVTQECGDLPCPKWVVGAWSKCTKTCGGGNQSRNITCKNNHVGECLTKDKPTSSKGCSNVPCPEWVAGAWSKCTKTCGGGNQSRNITCKNNHVGECLTKDKPTSSKGCSNVPCPEWVVGSWSECTKTCGGGNQTRNITCENNHVGECLTKDKPTSCKGCSDVPCPEWVVGAWSKCTKTCGGGNQSRNITCKNNHVGECLTKDKPTSSKGCSNVPCPKWVVGAWGECTKTCGGGNQTRNVTCKNNHVGECTDDKPDVFRECGDLPCPEWVVGAWSECTKTCGGGNQTRNITCENNHVGRCSLNDQPVGTRKCGDVPCPEWSTGQWSSCTKSCGGGIQSRDVVCKNLGVGNCPRYGKPHHYRPCNNMACPKWLSGQWGECSKSCEGGVKTRKVYCSGSWMTSCGGVKPPSEQPCNLEACPQWVVSPWSHCHSRKCGDGKMIRRVTCTGKTKRSCKKEAKPTSRQACKVPCPKWKTSRWSQCKGSCLSAKVVRRVWCDGGSRRCKWNSKPRPSKSCWLSACAVWAPKQWNSCPVTCGGGMQSRSVRCINKATNKSLSSCNKKVKPVMYKGCALVKCPNNIIEDAVLDDKNVECQQHKKDEFFCSLLPTSPSLRKLCDFKKWALKCCHDCSKVAALTGSPPLATKNELH